MKENYKNKRPKTRWRIEGEGGGAGEVAEEVWGHRIEREGERRNKKKKKDRKEIEKEEKNAD